MFTTIHSTARSSFTNVHGYAADIPCFGCPWGFNMGYNTCNFPDVPNWSPENVDARLADALKGSAAQDTFNYDGVRQKLKYLVSRRAPRLHTAARECCAANGWRACSDFAPKHVRAPEVRAVGLRRREARDVQGNAGVSHIAAGLAAPHGQAHETGTFCDLFIICCFKERQHGKLQERAVGGAELACCS